MDSEISRAAETESQASHNDAMSQGPISFDHTKRTISRAYTRSARAIGDTYNHAMTYGRENPGKTTLLAFGIGLGVGMLLLGSRRHSRVRRYGEPIVSALSNMAMEFIRKF